VQSALVELLLDSGAAVDGVEQDVPPLMTAFRFHYPKAAETLARRGATIDNVIAAAALAAIPSRYWNQGQTNGVLSRSSTQARSRTRSNCVC
jgi:hypothetical protein